MKRLVLVGGGGFSKEVAEIATLTGFTVCGYVADTEGAAAWSYLGAIEYLPELRRDYDSVAFAIGAINRDGLHRRRLIINKLIEMDIPIATLVSPYAIVSAGVHIGIGSVICHAAVLSVDSHVGDFCILNTATILGHDSMLKANVVMAPQAMVAGSVKIDENCLLGPGSVILESKTVQKDVIVGTRAVVHRNVPEGSTVMPLVSKVLKNNG